MTSQHLPSLLSRMRRLRTPNALRADPYSEAVAWKLLDITHTDPAPLWAYLFLVIVLGATLINCMRDAWAVGWTILGLCVVVGSLIDFFAYPALKAAGRLVFAQRCFMVMSLCQGVLWGVANLILLLSHNPYLQFWVINAETGVLSLTVARLNPMVTDIQLEVSIALVCLTVCCLASGNVYFEAYALLALIYLVALIPAIRDLGNKTIRMLTSEEKAVELLQREAAANTRLEAANRQLEAMATTDGLTGIPNRRCFDTTMRSEWNRSARAGTRLSMLLMDIDKFKSYNDTLGHLAGDACLRLVATSLAGAIRPSDVLARYGGEEFAVIVPNADAFETIDIAERLRIAVEAMGQPSPSGGPVTVSIGAASCLPVIDPAASDDADLAPKIAALIAEADTNLYAAKKAGRNCVRASPDQQTTAGTVLNQS